MGVVLALVLGAAPASAVDYRPVQTLANNKCLDIADGGTSSLVQVWDCNGRYWQTWNYVNLGGNLYQIKSGMAGVNRCLTSRGHGMQAVMTTCANYDDQKWRAYNVGGSPHYWRSEAHGGCLDVKDGGRSNVVWVWQDCTLANNQLWRVA